MVPTTLHNQDGDDWAESNSGVNLFILIASSYAIWILRAEGRSRVVVASRSVASRSVASRHLASHRRASRRVAS